MGKTILVADDSRTIRRAVELTFRATDFQIVAVDSADQALRSIAEIRPDLVLADASMPGTDGYALCNAIKSSAASSRIPVLLLASKFDPFDEGRGKDAHADGHIDKPWDTQTLIDLVKSKTGIPIDATAPQSFAATLARRSEKSDPPPQPPPQPIASRPSNGHPPSASPFGAPVERTPSRIPSRPPSVAPKAPAQPPVPARGGTPELGRPDIGGPRRGPKMGGSLDDVLIEEPVDHPVGPQLEPPPLPKRPRAKVDVWALDEEVKRAPDAGPPPGADDAIEEIAIDDMPPDEPQESAEEPLRATVAKIANSAAPAVANAVEPMVPGASNEALTAAAREIIERIAWEVVPELAEAIIRAELARLLAEEE